MSTLLHAFPSVQIDAFESADLGSEPFTIGPDELAYDTGFTIGLEDGVYRIPPTWPPERILRFCLGRAHGRWAREANAAREVGFALGYAETLTASEPPAGYAPHEKDAYRAGYAEGLAQWEQERESDAYLDSMHAEAEYDAWVAAMDAGYIGADAEHYRLGAVS